MITSLKWLLRSIKTESYGMIRHNSLHPSLSPQRVQHIAELFFLFLCLNQFHSLRSAFASIAFSMLSGRVGKKSMPVILST